MPSDPSASAFYFISNSARWETLEHCPSYIDNTLRMLFPFLLVVAIVPEPIYTWLPRVGLVRSSAATAFLASEQVHVQAKRPKVTCSLSDSANAIESFAVVTRMSSTTRALGFTTAISSRPWGLIKMLVQAFAIPMQCTRQHQDKSCTI